MACIELQKMLQVPGKNECFAEATSAKEKGKKFHFKYEGKKKICRVRVDNCLITDTGVKKCDFLFKVNDEKNNKYYLIELKGIDLKDAVLQIISTYVIVNEKIKAVPDCYKGVIVSSAVPAATESRFRALQDKCYRENKLKIIKTHVQHTEKI